MSEQLTYTVVDGAGQSHEYTGFTSYRNPTRMIEGRRLVMVWWDGEPDLYVTDGSAAAIEELRRHFTDSGMEGFTFQVFTLTTVSDGELVAQLRTRFPQADSFDLRTAVRNTFIEHEEH